MNPHSLLVTVFASFVAINGPPATADDQRDFFEKKIRPVLVKHCYECHSASADEIGGKLLVDSRDGMLVGGESGPVLLSGQPDESLIIQSLRYDGLEMPPDAPLSQAVINDFVKWVSLGAADPRKRTAPRAADTLEHAFSEDPESLWSFMPRRLTSPPAVKNQQWARDSIDRFVLARLEQAGLVPTHDASARTLVRRMYFDLLGLPPTHDQSDAFVRDFDQDPESATERLVDHLLASHQFGERWGRHWLDVARYGESNGDDGLGRNATFPHAWRYRDYVIDAFNRDLPYDRFLVEQIAGDLLPAKTAQQRNRQLTATGFLAIGSKPAVAMNKNFAMDVVDDQINTVCTTVLGLSVACARCHDHKHDPIPTRDYYALAGIFRSTQTLYGAAGNEKLTAPPTPLHELRSKLSEIRKSPNRASPPAFPDDYSDSIDALKPSLHAKLDAAPDSLTVEPKADYSAKEFAAVKDLRFTGELSDPGDSYTVSLWFRNTVKNDARPITAYLFSRAKLGDKTLPGDHLGIGGNHEKSRTGKLFVFNGNVKKKSAVGTTVIPRNSWNHVVLVRDRKRIKVFLNGQLEIESELESTFGDSREFCIASRSDKFAPLTGNLGEFALFTRALSDDEALQLHSASGQPRGIRLAPPLGFAMGVREQAKPVDCKIHINGDGQKLGPEVARGVLTAYREIASDHSGRYGIAIEKNQSGRAALADWLARPDHPQTARVMVNRIWMHLQGRGIVTTPDDFGVYGSRPSHPYLLDHLAERFVQDGWSVKRLIRSIVLSRTYRLASQCDPQHLQADPLNIWMARHSRRRLDAESLRDSLLHASGTIDCSPDQGSAIESLDMLINWPPGNATDLHRESNHRSIYLCMLRHAPPKQLVAFDLPDGVSVLGQREITTLPTQALFLLNSKFVVQQSRELARRLLQDDRQSDRDRVQQLFSAVLHRTPSQTEVEKSLDYVRSTSDQMNESAGTQSSDRSSAWAGLCQAVMTTNEFRYVD